MEYLIGNPHLYSQLFFSCYMYTNDSFYRCDFVCLDIFNLCYFLLIFCLRFVSFVCVCVCYLNDLSVQVELRYIYTWN